MSEDIPLKIFRLGAVSLLVWGEDPLRVDVKKSQKNPSGDWEYTRNFHEDDLPAIQLLANEATV